MPSPAAAPRQHGVVFYANDNKFLCEAITDFCVRALNAGDPLVLIATAEHLAAMRGHLREFGFSWPQLCLAGRAAEFDADELLAEFSPAGTPDERLFRTVMERVLAPWSDLPEGSTVRAFGEMVDVLCRRNQAEDAILLEKMWNDLARSHRFTLLCAYSMGNFYREVNGSPFSRICQAHDHLCSSA